MPKRIELSKTFFAATILMVLWIFYGCKQHAFETTLADALPDYVDFNYHIKPILSDRCYTCHGPNEADRKADLRLDTKERAFSALADGKKAIYSKNPDKSILFSRIYSDDADYKMPPPESKLELSQKEIALIYKWIDQGAEWKEHWSFTKPSKASVPSVEDPRVDSEIDRFITKSLEHLDLNLSKRADKETLLRRITLDLTRLPPTLSEIQGNTKETGLAWPNGSWIQTML